MTSRIYRRRPPKDGGTNKQLTAVNKPPLLNDSSQRNLNSNYYNILSSHRRKPTTHKSKTKTHLANSRLSSLIHHPYFLYSSSKIIDQNYLDGFTLIKNSRTMRTKLQRFNNPYPNSTSVPPPKPNDSNKTNIYI